LKRRPPMGEAVKGSIADRNSTLLVCAPAVFSSRQFNRTFRKNPSSSKGIYNMDADKAPTRTDGGKEITFHHEDSGPSRLQ